MQKQSLSDEALVALAKNDDDAAMAMLITRMIPLAKARASKYHGVHISEEDLFQEGMLGFLDAVRSFDETKTASFRTYAGVCMQNRMRSAVRAQTGDRHAVLNMAIPLTEDAFPGNETADDPQNIVVKKEDSTQLLHFLSENLTALEQRVVALYIKGESYAAIAKELAISPKSVDNALQRVRAKAKGVI